MEIVEVAPKDERLGAVYPVMHELRDHLSEQQFNDLYETSHPEGYRVVGLFDGDECRACAGYRILTSLVSGRYMYVDDLVTAEKWRSHGCGRLLNKYLAELARNEDCSSVELDSNTRRQKAHRFYFRERYTIVAFHFTHVLGSSANE
jgi:GNAT superfamily N-acetyltransferase